MRHGNNLIIAAALLLCLVNSGFQCRKSFGCAGTLYNFKLGVKAYPDTETVIADDTIWLEINEPTTLQDIRTGRDINWSNAANLGSVLSFHQLSNQNEFTVKAADKFDFHLVNGTKLNSIDPSFEREYRFDEKNGYYLFKLGVIPKEKGTFRLFFSNAANVYLRNDRCSKSNFIINFRDTDQHYYLSPTYQGGNLVGGDYYFKVVE